MTVELDRKDILEWIEHNCDTPTDVAELIDEYCDSYESAVNIGDAILGRNPQYTEKYSAYTKQEELTEAVNETVALRTLVEAQEGLIGLYYGIIRKHVGFLLTHGIRDTQEEINEGKRLRAAIDAAKEGLGL
jgi:hypothetical protein